MPTRKIACVQMDCQLGQKQANLDTVCTRLKIAAENGADLIIFPECALTGYGFNSKEEAWPHAEPVPGPSCEALVRACRDNKVHAVVGSLEREESTGHLFNVALLLGPDGLVHCYRKIHLPYLGVDRYTTPGNQSFAVHDIGGLRVGMNICYDAGFPEAARCLAVLGADLVVLPTNWPNGARIAVKYLVQARAMENQIFYACCNRVGEEGGFPFIGLSRIININGELISHSDDAQETILYADIDPEKARNKHIVFEPGRYELHRSLHRRPDMYGPLTEPLKETFKPKG